MNALLILLWKSNERRFGRRQLAGPLAAGACEGAWQRQRTICHRVLRHCGKNGLNPHSETSGSRTSPQPGEGPLARCRGWLGMSTAGGVGPGPCLIYRAAYEPVQEQPGGPRRYRPAACRSTSFSSRCARVPAEAVVTEW